MTARVPPFIREVCPVCLLGAEGCLRCSGTGYVLKNPWDPRTSGEQRDEGFSAEPELEVHGDACRVCLLPVSAHEPPRVSWWKRALCWLAGHDYCIARWRNGHSALLCRRCTTQVELT